MPSHVRFKSPGLTYFFTARAARKGGDLFVCNVDALRSAMRRTRDTHPFDIDEIVVLPDVIHTLWTLPEGDENFSLRWRMLKSLFSRSVDAPGLVGGYPLRPGEKGLWQRRFWEHVIRDADDLAAHRHMIFCAPVQAGLVNRPAQWAHSSIHRAMAGGADVPESVGEGHLPYVPERVERAPYAISGLKQGAHVGRHTQTVCPPEI